MTPSKRFALARAHTQTHTLCAHILVVWRGRAFMTRECCILLFVQATEKMQVALYEQVSLMLRCVRSKDNASLGTEGVCHLNPEAARLEEEAERARGIAEELRMAEDDAREKEAAEEEVKCRRVGEEEAARFGQEAEREMERAEVKAVEGEKIRDACYAVEEVKSQGRRRRDSDLQSQEMSPFAQKVSRPQVRRTQYHPPSKPRVSQVTKHESRVSGKLNWSSAGASHARMQSTSILRVRAQTNATELATELAAATERAASTHLTYGERGLRMQRQIAEINAIRSTLMKGRSLEPPARHKISPSATRSSYFEQVKARLVAEKQKRIHQQLHCRRRKLRELSSIYGDRHSSPGRR